MLAALLTLLGAAAPATPSPRPAEAPVSAAATSPALTPITPLAASADVVLDTLLPCGLRVLTARDLSLPVAAVVLALEVGSEDDPPELPGLVHALAYQLEQGNRELRPAEAIATAQDAGGTYSRATGPAQVRFESLIPASRLDPVLWVESQRLRTPTTAPQRWQQSLAWAASDERGGSRLRPEALALVHGAPGLGHDGRAPSKALSALPEAALAAQLAATFNYARATLVVVGPESPDALLARVAPLFADLPPAARSAPDRSARSPAAEAPAQAAQPPGEVSAPLARQRGQTFVWPVPPSAAAGAWATALCRAINRQKKPPEPEEPRKARLSCEYEPDARRGVLILRPGNVDDARALVRARLARLGPGGADAALLQAQAAVVAQALRLAVRTPAGLARQLAMSEVPAPPGGGGPSFQHQHRVDELTGLAALADPGALVRVAPGLLRVEDAVVLTFPEGQP